MDAELLIVDGHNIINAWKGSKLLDDGDINRAREQLVEVLLSCTAYWGWELAIVFDAGKVRGGLEKEEQIAPHAKMFFSGEGASADSVIERLVAHCEHKHVVVATSDAAEQSYAFGKGAIRWPARELLRRVETARREILVKSKSTKDLRGTMVDRLPEEVAEVLNQMRLRDLPKEGKKSSGASRSS